MKNMSKHPVLALLLAGMVGYLVYSLWLRPAPARMPYSDFLAALDQGRVTELRIEQDELIAKIKPSRGSEAPTKNGAPQTTPGKEQPQGPRTVRVERLPGIDETSLLAELKKRGVHFSGKMQPATGIGYILLLSLLPLLLIFGIYFVAIRKMRKGGGRLDFGRSQPKIYDRSQHDPVTFEDVAGVEDAQGELEEVVGFLRHPERYRALGAQIPKGVLLVGAPGTGKTLLARAVAGEASVPFFSLSGSEFIEIFVGVGASRMRDLFEQAKKKAPCIVFIDELDAIGRARGGARAFAANDEREQTLNQLLVEMDGFDPRVGVVIMAATNRPEVLDSALLRAGRFDRRVMVDRPDLRGRRAILEIHAAKIVLAPDVDLQLVARRTPAMVGADLANIVNEAALAAGRRTAEKVEQRDFDEAIDRIQLGLEKQGRAMNEQERRRIAYHEAGHTLVALTVEHADPVHRVTIIPRSTSALGATLQLPTEDRYLMTDPELRDRICVMLGGRVAEQLVFGAISTGARQDLQNATELARKMVCEFGMSEELGPVHLGGTESPYSGLPLPLADGHSFSEATARVIDAEIRTLLETQQDRALRVVEARHEDLERIAQELLVRETLRGDEVQRLLGSADDGEDQQYQAGRSPGAESASA